MDLVGAFVLTAGRVVLDVQMWRGRRRILSMGRARLLVLGLAGLEGAVVLGWSVERDAGVLVPPTSGPSTSGRGRMVVAWWWLLGVGVLAGVQLVAAAGATTHRDEPRRRGVGTSVM